MAEKKQSESTESKAAEERADNTAEDGTGRDGYYDSEGEDDGINRGTDPSNLGTGAL
ncbi:hypothetical protein [Streptomyces sp. NPDC046727]|uniref:hypothetical protein n=1 Tax=Streptomyces sp. NPDC046727 TaxID=3155373 RepID=UPI0033F24084